MKNIKKTFFILLGFGFVCYALYNFFKLHFETSKNPITILNTDPYNYTNLFNEKARKNIVLKRTLSFKLRNPISIFNYNNKYSIEITKINSFSYLYPANDIKELYKETEETGNIIYTPIEEVGYLSKYRSTSTDTVSKIYLTLQGDSIKPILKNDSIALYNLNMKSFSIRYQLNKINEVYIKAQGSLSVNRKTPISLMFLRKRNSLYFLVLTANYPGIKMEPDLLYKLISR